MKRSFRPTFERLEDRSLLATFTWDGGGGNANWATSANWVGDIAPPAGSDLVFPSSAANLTNTNNFASGTNFNSILLTGGGYFVDGNAISRHVSPSRVTRSAPCPSLSIVIQ